MKRPDPDQLDALLKVAEHNPRFVEWLREWYLSELEALPLAVTNPTLSQGRCQVLQELVTQFDNAPKTAAKPPSRRQPPNTTHTRWSV